jgi:uncharacterized protein (DUF2062 family)
MIHEENRLNRRRLERIARVKRVLRWMPRRTNVHRYPVLKWFAAAARKRSYLWCFRVKNAVPALYAGCILALLPLYGIQLPIAVGLAFLFRANLPILTTAIFITNPVTILPAYFACFQIGRVLLHVFGMQTPQLNMAEMKLLIDALEHNNWSMNLRYLATVWWITALGGIILGTSIATIASGIYKLAAYEVTISFNRLKELRRKRQEEALKSQEQTTPPADDTV